MKDRILAEGVTVGSDRINVDGFINHRIDTSFMDEIGEEFARRFAGVKVDKILTVEASGIAIAVSAARYFGFCPRSLSFSLCRRSDRHLTAATRKHHNNRYNNVNCFS